MVKGKYVLTFNTGISIFVPRFIESERFMKKMIFYCFFLLLVSFVGCINESEFKLPASNLSGEMLLNIDKQTAPEGITEVSALLTRPGYPNISASLNLLTDTSASITLQNVSTGNWHLLIEAKDSVGAVLYSGETDVNILAGILTIVNLTLNPTGYGTGTINIVVNWGTVSQYDWIDYLQNPLISSLNNNYDFLGVAQPTVIFDDNKFKMWYTGIVSSGKKYVLYRESMDGINWTQGGNFPHLSPGINTWDALAAHACAILKEGGVLKMYYCGYSSVNGAWHIGLATSADGISWTKLPTPVLMASSGWESQIVPKSILKIGNEYYLYYTGRNYPTFKIGLAISSDGLNWTKYSNNPILQPTDTWEGSGVYDPSVIYDGAVFKMVYAVPNSAGFGWATSVDGKDWIKSSSNPFFRRDQTSNNWASSDVAYPCFLKTSGDYRIYYSGFNNTITSYRIGLLRKQN